MDITTNLQEVLPEQVPTDAPEAPADVSNDTVQKVAQERLPFILTTESPFLNAFVSSKTQQIDPEIQQVAKRCLERDRENPSPIDFITKIIQEKRGGPKADLQNSLTTQKEIKQQEVPLKSSYLADIESKQMSTTTPERQLAQRSKALSFSLPENSSHPFTHVQGKTSSIKSISTSSKKKKSAKRKKDKLLSLSSVLTEMDSNSDRDANDQSAFVYETLPNKTKSFCESLAFDCMAGSASKVDILRLFFEVMKLELENERQSKKSRNEERIYQINHMLSVVESWKNQKKSIRTTTFISGAIGIVGGALPIFGQFAPGYSVWRFAQRFSKFENLDRETFFKGMNEMARSISESTRTYTQAEIAEHEATRTRDQHLSDINRVDQEENTRRIAEFVEEFNQLARFLQQMLQMEYDATAKLHY